MTFNGPTGRSHAEQAALNHGYGAVMGALVGDAAGAVLEFLGRPPREDEVEHALTLPGGGCWGVAPGQLTDDGELTLCLLNALPPRVGYDVERVAAAYVAWYRSRPFDVGGTTAAALGAFVPGSNNAATNAAAVLVQAARDYSHASKANGSLMRASPIGVWGYELSADVIASAARQDSALTHPNPSCADAVAAYAIAIAALIRTAGDRMAAFAESQAWVSSSATQEVREWLTLAESGARIPYHPQAGFVKIAFVHAFRHLLTGSGFVAALRETLLGGGDTDTNACIVGGLIGAADGIAGVPSAMAATVLNCDTRAGRPRPEFLHPRDTKARVEALVRGTSRSAFQ